MKYIETKDGKVYKVIHENFGIGSGHHDYVCSTLGSYGIIIGSGSDEKRMDACPGIVFVDKGDVLREYDELPTYHIGKGE